MKTIRSGLEAGEKCFDNDSPFDLVHEGKLIPPIISIDRTRYLRETPRLHCVAKRPDDTSMLVRFTPLHKRQVSFSMYGGTGITEVGVFFRNPEEALELYKRHLAKLGELGLLPWISGAATGTCSELDGAPGIFTEQPILPAGSKAILHPMEQNQFVQERLKLYDRWAREEKEPAYLSDLPREGQFSKLPGEEIVLHDIEPIFTRLQ